MAYATVTLSGTYQTPNRTAHKGHVEIIPSERVIKDTTGDVILTGRVKVDLDAQGAFSVELPATDDPTLNPTGFGYTIAAKLHSSHPPAVSFSLPAALGATTVEDLTPVDPSTFEATATYADASTVTALDSRVTTVESDITTKADTADIIPADRSHSALPGGYSFGKKIATSTTDYLSFPGTVRTIGGEFLIAYRKATSHDLATGSNNGTIAGRFVYDNGNEIGDEFSILSIPGSDVRDLYLYRAPGERRIYLGFYLETTGVAALSGCRLAWSDDDGRTWTAPATVTTDGAAAARPRKGTDGTWRWPIYRLVSGNWRAQIITATDPTGTWSAPIDVFMPGHQPDATGAADATEWDFVEVTPTNWILVFRVNGAQIRVTRSTDQLATRPPAPPSLAAPGGTGTYDGWPTLRLTDDGRVLMFIRGLSTVAGLRVLQMVDVDATPNTAWSVPGKMASFGYPLDTGTGPGFAAKFDPVKVGGAWVGAYMVETTMNDVAEIRWGVLPERSVREAWSWVVGGEKIPDSSAPGFQQLTTPDQIVVRSHGEWWDIGYIVRSQQIGGTVGTVSNYQLDVFDNGNMNGSNESLYLAIDASDQDSSTVWDQAEGRRWLSPGYHLLTLRYRQDTTTTGRTFARRWFYARPVT